MSTTVLASTTVVKRDGEYERRHNGHVSGTVPEPLVLLRINEVLEAGIKAGRFKSARDWAEKAGCSVNYVNSMRSRMGKGTVKHLGPEEAAALARIAGVDERYLNATDVDDSIEEAKAVARDGTVAQMMKQDTLEEAVRVFRWPDALEPEQAAEVLRRVRDDAFKASESLPVSYWSGRLRRLANEVLGRAKDVPEREPAEVVDLTQESPEIRAHRAAKKKR